MTTLHAIAAKHAAPPPPQSVVVTARRLAPVRLTYPPTARVVVLASDRDPLTGVAAWAKLTAAELCVGDVLQGVGVVVEVTR